MAPGGGVVRTSRPRGGSSQSVTEAVLVYWTGRWGGVDKHSIVIPLHHCYVMLLSFLLPSSLLFLLPPHASFSLLFPLHLPPCSPPSFCVSFLLCCSPPYSSSSLLILPSLFPSYKL